MATTRIQSRRPARVFAMQVLYALRVGGGQMGDVLAAVLEGQTITAEQRRYGMGLVDTVQEQAEPFDAILLEMSPGWSLDRMPVIDRAVLHVAFAEFAKSADVPVRVIISEAVQIARKYSTTDSGTFVNGVLDAYARKKGLLADPE